VPKQVPRSPIDVPWRVVGTRIKPDRATASRRLGVGAAIGGVAVIAVVLAYFIINVPGGPEVLIQPGTSIGVPESVAWEVGKGGTLLGGFSVANGTAEVCFANYDMFSYAVAHGLSYNQCPSNATYSSGFAASGVLSGNFGQGVIYLQTFVPLGWTQGQPRPTIVWTAVVEIQPS